MLAAKVRPILEWERRVDKFGQKLSPQEQKVARYIEQNQRQFREISIKQIAAAAMVSQATVVRFCHRLGYEGLKELKISMAEDKQLTDLPVILQKDVFDSNKVLHETIRRYIICLEDTALIDNTVAFEQAVSAIMRAKQIDIYGVGGSRSSMSFVRHMLIRIGIRANECSNIDTQQLSAATLEKDDVVIIISNKGESRELLQMIPRARERGAVVIFITARQRSLLVEMSDIVLYAAGGTRPDTISAPRVGINALLDALCHSIVERKAREQDSGKNRGFP